MAVLAPETVIAGRYRVVQPLGEGGMKAVYLGEDLRFKARLCALAVMVDNFASDEARRHAVLSFEREADVLAELDHPAIPKVSDRFSELDHHYFVMDYVDGQTLEAKLAAAGGRLSQVEAIDIALQICDALDYLHRRNPPVVYRDLKPSNLMVTPEGKVKLVDFGIARHFTRQGTIVGTIGYAAPEQYQGLCEPRSDIYALGATLHHLLSGRDPARFPFDFPPLSTLIPNCDPTLEQLVAQALNRERDERVTSACEFARRLQSIEQAARESSPVSGGGKDSPGMRYCSRCGVAIPRDATGCPSCAEQPAPSASRQLRTINVATINGVTTHNSAAAPNRFVLLAIVSIVAVIVLGLIARHLWGSSAAIAWPFWILAGLALMVIEVHYTQDFTLFCFGISALLVGLMTFLGIFDRWTQWVSFAALSTGLLFSAREWLRRKLVRPGSGELENIIGQSAIPLDDLPAYGFGKAELRGSTWTAHNATHTRILRGQRCRVMKLNGLTLWIIPE